LKYYYLITSILFFSLIPSHAKVLKFRGQLNALPEPTLLEIYQKANTLITQIETKFDNPFTATLLQKNDDIYLHLFGLSYLFKYIDGEFENLYLRNFHGYNFSSYTFTFQDKILNYGGSGFWRANNNLIFFDDQLNEWEFILSSEDITDNNINNPILYFSYENQLYFLTTDDINYLRNGLVDSQYNFYTIDLDQLKTSPLGSQLGRDESMEWRGFSEYFETDQYVLLLSRTGLMYRIIDKKNLTFKDIAKGDQNLINIKTDISTIKNNLYLSYSQGNNIQLYGSDLTSILTLDLDLFYHTFGEVEKDLIYHKNPIKTIALIVIPLVFLSGLFLQLKNKSNNLDDQTIPEVKINLTPHTFPYPTLLNLNEQIISQEHLDECLELKNLSFHSIRNKRSSILREIKNKYPDLIAIERIQDPVDGRIYQYKIQIIS
jgi:hypothetical protein